MIIDELAASLTRKSRNRCRFRFTQ